MSSIAQEASWTDSLNCVGPYCDFCIVILPVFDALVSRDSSAFHINVKSGGTNYG